MKQFAYRVACLCVSYLLSASQLLAQGSGRLIGWWKLDDATNATVLADSSGYGRNASLGSGVSIVDGRFGKAARFNGTSTAWASFNTPLLTNVTISAWVYVDGLPTNILPRIMQLGEFYYHMPLSGLGNFNFGKSGTGAFDWGTNVQAPFKFVTNTWFHAAVVYRQQYTSETARVVWPTFYINGVRCGDPGAQRAFTSAIPAGSGCIGNNGAGSIRPLNGMLDDVRLYDAPLSDKEVLQVYQNRSLAVDAGKDQTCYRETALLQGRLINTNPFMRDLAANTAWSVVSAPGGATPVIQLPWLPDASVTLPVAGTYSFRLTASNEFGVASDDVTLVRNPGVLPEGNAAPTVTPLWLSTNTVLGAGAPLAATVADDGTLGALRVRWSKVSGPGAAFFDNPFTNSTTAFFSTNGTYTLALEADDGALTRSANVSVTVTLPVSSLSDGLAHWWRMDDDPVLKRAFDSAGTNTLNFTSPSFLQPGKTGYGYRLPKADSAAQATNVLISAELMTFSAWFYHDNAYTNNAYMRLYNCGPNFYLIYVRADNTFSLSTTGTNATQYTWNFPDAKLNTNQWFHVSALFDRRAAASDSKQVLYLNGKRYLSSSIAPTSAFPGAAAFTSPFVIGNASPTGGTRNFDGVLDEMRVYNRFITDEEARLLASDPDNNHAPVIESPANLMVKVASPIALQSAVTDDGQPLGKTLTRRWSVTSGDASNVHFTDASVPGTTATFTKTGDYVIMLSASDGEQQAASLVHVTVAPTGTLLSVR